MSVWKRKSSSSSSSQPKKKSKTAAQEPRPPMFIKGLTSTMISQNSSKQITCYSPHLRSSYFGQLDSEIVPVWQFVIQAGKTTHEPIYNITIYSDPIVSQSKDITASCDCDYSGPKEWCKHIREALNILIDPCPPQPDEENEVCIVVSYIEGEGDWYDDVPENIDYTIHGVYKDITMALDLVDELRKREGVMGNRWEVDDDGLKWSYDMEETSSAYKYQTKIFEVLIQDCIQPEEE